MPPFAATAAARIRRAGLTAISCKRTATVLEWWTWLVLRAAKWIACGLVVLLLVFLSARISDFTGTPTPILFYGPLKGELLGSYPDVLVIAHNSGNTPPAARLALAYNADVIEIDVVSANGRLHAAHDRPAPVLGARLYRAPTLASVWHAAGEARMVQLDLKDSSPSYLDKVFGFVNQHPDSVFIVSSRNVSVLEVARREAPSAFRLLSVGNRAQLELLHDGDTVALLDGVSLRIGLADQETVAWLKEEGLTVFAWVANKLKTVNELVKFGIDGIVTDNLALMELLGGSKGEDVFARSIVDDG